MAKHRFQLISSFHLDDFKAEGELWRHENGMEVFAARAVEGDYFFSYSFKTLPEDSTGVFHILEHTVLSGSEKYPARDPFSLLDANSCNSYMNAMTFPDRTVYPAASPVKKDADNIFSLYTDSLFAPLLRYSTFTSEGIGVGEEGFEGVVFNEMRGDANQCDTIVSTRSKRDLLEGTPYAFSSGGDVEAMTGLSYEAYLETYRRCYNPANCRLMLYGKDIDLEEKFELLESYFEKAPAPNPIDPPADTVRWTQPRRETVTCQAANGDGKGSFMLSFLSKSHGWVGYDNVFVSVLVDALLGSPSSPLYSAMLDSRLGSDLSDESGMSADFNEIPFLVGLGGVDEKDVDALESYILSTIEKIAREGIDPMIIEASLRRQEFLVQEVASGIPQGLRIFLKCIRGWERGLPLDRVLDSTSVMKKLREDLAANSRLFEDWMMENLVNNPHRLSLFVKPVADQVEKQEERLHSAWLEKKDSYRQPEAEDIPEDIDFPQLTLDDVAAEGELTFAEDMGKGLYYLEDNTCSITYLTQVVDLSDLSGEDLLFAILLSRYITNAGLVDESAASFHGRLRLESGGYYAYLETGAAKDGKVRAFFGLWLKCLSRQLGSCLDLLEELMKRLDCEDEEGIEDALNDLKSDYESYVEESGFSFVSSLATASLSPSYSLGEQLMGITSWQSLCALTIEECREGLKRIISLFSDRSRLSLHLCCEEKDKDESVRLGHDFLSRFEDRGGFRGAIEREVEEKDHRIWYVLPSSVSYNALSLPSSPTDTRESRAEAFFARILTKTSLWQRIRMEGGAYGVEAQVDSNEGSFTVATYRDPHVGLSFEAIEDCIRNTELTEELLTTAKITSFGRLLMPIAPQQKATLALRRCIYQVEKETVISNRNASRTLTLEEIESARARLIERLEGGQARYASMAPVSIFTNEAIEGASKRTLPE